MKLMINRITVGILVASQFVYGTPVYAEKYISEPSAPINGRAPVASGLAFDNSVPAIGDTVTLSYVFEDLDGDIELGSTVRWLRDGQPIQGATAFSYTLDKSKGDRPGQRLSAEITPKTDANITEPAVGLPVSIEATVAGNPDAKPVVKVTDIVGTLNQGETLTGQYTYDDNTTGSPDASTLSWVNGGHVSSDAAYMLDADDVGKVLTFEVEAKNQAGTVGNTDRIDTATASGVTGGSTITPGAVVNAAAIPSISNLKISGDLQLGSTLTSEYTFNANNGDDVDASLVQWGFRGDTAALVSTTGKPLNVNYVLIESDVGQVIEVSVQAKNSLGVTGLSTTIDTISGGGLGGLVIDPAAIPSISDLKITGDLKLGSTLASNYIFHSNNGDTEDASLLKWGREGETQAQVSTGTPLDKNYTIVQSDVGQVLEVSAQAKNSFGVAGVTQTVTTASLTSGGTGGTVIDPAAQPSISDLKISGYFTVGNTLTSEYTFNANNGYPNDASLLKWGREGETQALVGTGTPLGKTYAIVEGDVGQVLEVSALAKNNGGIAGGTQTASIQLPVYKGPIASGLSISSTSSNGFPYTGGQTLTASYTYSHPDGEAEDKTIIQWYVNNVPIQGATAKTYKLKESDVGKQITFSVIPGSVLNEVYHGVIVYSAPTVNIASVIEPLFLVSNDFVSTWFEAVATCKANGGVLPSPGDFSKMYIKATSANALSVDFNLDMEILHGWNLTVASGFYWTSEEDPRDPGYYIMADMKYGSALYSFDPMLGYLDLQLPTVVCKR